MTSEMKDKMKVFKVVYYLAGLLFIYLLFFFMPSIFSFVKNILDSATDKMMTANYTFVLRLSGYPRVSFVYHSSL